MTNDLHLSSLLAALATAGDDDRALAAVEAQALAAVGSLPAARAIAACAFDRRRWLAGRPQKFGTVAVVGADGVMELWAVDPLTTDSERAKWGLPALWELGLRARTGRPPFDSQGN